MSDAELRKLIDFASRFCEQMFARQGAIYPLYHAVTSSGEHFYQTPPAPDKNTAVAMIRALFELRDVVRYIFSMKRGRLRSPSLAKRWSVSCEAAASRRSLITSRS